MGGQSLAKTVVGGGVWPRQLCLWTDLQEGYIRWASSALAPAQRRTERAPPPPPGPECGGPPGAPPGGRWASGAQGSLPSTVSRPRSRCLLRPKQLLEYLCTLCWFQNHLTKAALSAPSVWAQEPQRGQGRVPALGVLAATWGPGAPRLPLSPSSGPKAPKSGTLSPLRAGGARPREGTKPPCSLPRCGSGAGWGRGPPWVLALPDPTSQGGVCVPVGGSRGQGEDDGLLMP